MSRPGIFDLATAQGTADRPYHEFIREQSMSAGIYRLAAGASDLQQPHTEDEIYYVISGKAMFHVNDQEHTVGAGDTIFVPALAPHHFHSITEDLTLLVIFAPPEGSAAQLSHGVTA